MAQGDVGVKVGADTTGLQAGMVQAATVTEAQMKKIAQMVKAANDATANLGRTTQKAASDVASAHASIAEGAKKVEGAHAGVNRELLVLAHEMSQGNYSRFGGSLLVLAERTNFLSFALSGTGILVSALGAAVLGTGALMAMGAIEADKLAKALQLTGNYAAVSEESIRSLADAQAKQTGQTAGAARGSIEAVAGSGLFGPSELAAVSRAMGDYQHLTRATADEALKNFASIQDGVAKWAEEQNKSVHFLTSAEFEHIKALEDSGQKQAAAIEVLNAYSGAIESRGEPAIGSLARAMHWLGDEASRVGQAIMDIGRPTDELASKIAAVTREQQGAFARQAQMHPSSGGDEYLMSLASEQARLQQLQFRAGERRSDASTNAGLQQAAIESNKYVESVLRGAHALSQRTEELKKWDATVAGRAAANNPMSQTDIDAGRAEINKRYANHAAAAQVDEYKNLQATIRAFNSTTDEEISRMGKLTDGQKFSIQAHEELTKAGKKLSDQQRSTIASAIDEAAAHRTVADMLLAAQKATIARIQADTANQEQQQRNVESVIQAGNDQANGILRQSQLIGKSADEVLKIQQLQKFDDLIGKALLGADNDGVKRINQVAAVLRGNLVSSIDSAKAAQDEFNSSFTNGFQKASDEYAKQAANNAAFGEKVFSDATSAMSDSLAECARTGHLSFKSLIDSMISDLIRFEAQKGFAALFGSGGSAGGLLGTLGGLFGGGAGGASGATPSAGDYSTAGLQEAFGYANGLDYVPYDGFPAILHEGEKVTRRQDAAVERSKDGGHTFDFSGAQYSFGAGVDAAGVAAAVRNGNAQTKADIMRSISTGGRA